MFGLVKSAIENLLAGKAIREGNAFIAAAKTPKEAQHAFLFDLIRQHAGSDFGRDHGFDKIQSIKDFREQIPIAEYDAFKPYIDRVVAGETSALFVDESIVMFALSSGTTNSRKYIPVTQRYLDDYRRGWRLWGIAAFGQHPKLFLKGKIGFGSAAQESLSPTGIPCGNLSGLTVRMNPWIVRQSYCLPADAADFIDGHERCYMNWRLGVMRDVGMCVAPNPGLLLQFGQYGDENRERLIREVREGTYRLEADVPAKLRKFIDKRTRPNAKRANELESIVERTGHLYPKDVWEDLELVCCWLGGPTRSYVNRLKEYYGDVSLRDIGLISSEAKMSIPAEDNTPGGVLDVTSTYYEFIPEEEMDTPNPTVLETHELEQGRNYFIIVTTTSGLYRYNIRDVVRVIGTWENTPVVEFLHKGNRVANFFGEKISESQVAAAVAKAAADLEIDLGDYSVVAPADVERPHYTVGVESSALETSMSARRDFAASFDACLGAENYLYERKIEDGLLGPCEVITVPAGFWKNWDRRQLLQRGGTIDQYKHPFLITDPTSVDELFEFADTDSVSPTAQPHVASE